SASTSRAGGRGCPWLFSHVGGGQTIGTNYNEQGTQVECLGEPMTPQRQVRPATRADAAAVAAIYNEGIADRTATFETRPRSAGDVLPWFNDTHPVVVVEEDGRVIAFAAASTSR